MDLLTGLLTGSLIVLGICGVAWVGLLLYILIVRIKY